MNDARRRRIVFWGSLTFLVVVLLAFVLWPRAIPVDVAVVDEGPLRVTLDHEGRTRVRHRYMVSAPVAGRVQRIELEPGDPVARDETVVATFLPEAPPLLDARSRAERAARVRAAEAALAQARAQRDRAATEAEFARVERDRARGLESQGVVSAQSLEAAETEADSRARALAAGESAVNVAAYELEAARAALLRPGTPAGRPGSALALRAPIDGVVLRRLHESEAVVPQGEPLLEVADTSSLEVVADFLSADAVRIERGQDVSIEQWGGPGPLDGRVRRVEPSGFLKVSALGVEEQRVFVVIDFDDPRSAWRALGDGYRVEARVVVWERPRVVRAPASSLFRRGTGWAAFVVDGGRAVVRELKVGQRNGVSAEILSGLRAGEVVIVHPPDTVGDGARVANRPAGRGSR